ncbi:hypothetical protein, partial [Streptomyces sp. NRRL WC-3719]|uniref:hypothetical protein n=1 Tax=Streptomyces sp. NRRL WC-3719 TaxID=1463932 RepID=UPI001F1ADE35
SRTVGWFTTMFPVVLRSYDGWDAQIKHTKEALRAVPGRGIGFGALRHLRGELEAVPGSSTGRSRRRCTTRRRWRVWPSGSRRS